jgi:nucleoside-diphosphate-sugar epimerase
MRVFVTGATGFIGSAIVQNLLGAGHQVLGLARSDQSVDALAQAGVEGHRGNLTDTDSLVAGARACDGVIHTGFIHDFSQFMANVEVDRRALEAMVGALEGTGKPMVIASGTLMVSHARPATENDAPLSVEAPRAASEAMVLEAPGVRGSIVRLPPPVHDLTRAGLLTMMAASAREKGVSAYVGDGANVWPSVHRLDAARLFCLALEKAPPGSRLHAVAEEGIPMRTIAEAMGEGLGVPARSIAPEEAAAHFETMAMFVGLDNPSSSAITRELLGWSPREVGLLSDLRQGVATWQSTL